MNTNKIESFCRRPSAATEAAKNEKMQRRIDVLEDIAYKQKIRIAALNKQLEAKKKAIKEFLKPRDMIGFDCRGAVRAGK